MAVGALLGWLFGEAGLGLLVGAIAGIPLSVAVVYRVYARHRVVNARMFETPRPVPGALVPALAGTAVVVLALPVFAAAGWPLRGLAPCGDAVDRQPAVRNAVDAAPARGG